MVEAVFSLPIYLTTPAVLVGYSIVCLGAGLLIWALLGGHSLPGRSVSAGTIIATSFVVGQGSLAGLWLLLALNGWLSLRLVAPISLALIAIAGYVGAPIIARLTRQASIIWRDLRSESWGWQLLACLTVLLSLMWVFSLGRPLSGDGPAFYMALGKFIAASHRLIPMPGFEGFTNVGLHGELHFAALMVLHSPEAARLFAWPTILMGGVMLAALGRVVGMERRGQWLTLAMLFTSTAVIFLSGDGKVDLFAAALGMAAYYWAVQVRFRRTFFTLFLTGLLTGFSIIAKLSYAPVMLPSIALLVIWGYLNGHEGISRRAAFVNSAVRSSLIILLAVLIAAIPHMIKNGLLFQNPISPLGSEAATWVNQSWFGPQTARRILVTYPLAVTYGSYWAQYGNLSPLLLAFSPLALILPRPQRPLTSSPLAAVTGAALCGVIGWFLYNPSVFAPRYILATLLLFLLLPARAAEYVSLKDGRPRILAGSVMFISIATVVTVGLHSLGSVFYPGTTVQYLVGNVSECSRDGNYCNALDAINREAKLGARVYLASYQRYWLRGDLLQCSLRTDETEFVRLSSREDPWLHFYQKGVRFLFIDTFTHGAVLDRLDLQTRPSWVDLIPLYDDGQLFVYKINFDPVPYPVEPLVCRRLPSSRIWEVGSL